MFRVRLLGGFGVSVGGRVVEGDAWRLKKAKSLVKMLALAPGRRLHRERVMDVLWPRLGSAAAANNLHHALHAARKAVGDADFLRLEDEHLSLCPGAPLRVDVEEFEAAAAEARRTRGIEAYRAALDLYAGDLLPEDLYEEWAESRRSDLRGTRLSLLVELAALCEEDGNFTGAIEALKKVVEEEPTSEEAHGSLIRLYARLGWLAESVKQYQRLEGSLRRDLGVEPGPDARRIYQEALDGRYSPTRTLPSEAPRCNLPAALTSFVGREREMGEVEALLGRTRLLTLAGAGGSGKTRLAVEVGRGLVGEFEDGVWVVELAAVWEPGLVTQTVADVLSIHEQQFRPLSETLTDELRTKHLLLILDNCEHLVDGVAGFAEGLLGECPRLRILATSREVLRVPEEVVWRIPSLSLPDDDGSLEESAAARLFVERARSRRPEFEVGGRSAHAVVEICRRLDGIPLAIELAAAKIGTLSVEQISARLDDRLRLLVGGSRTAPSRQQTMRAAIEWSDALLDEPEKKLFRRLSVFAGGFTLEAAEVVGMGEGVGVGDVMNLLSGIVDKSQVAAESGREGAMRYGMLETIRQYGKERLEESGEMATVRERHARYFLDFAQEAEVALWNPVQGPEQMVWLDRLEDELDNLRAARDWAAHHDATLDLWLAGALSTFWEERSRLEEGREWLERALARGESGAAPLRAKALHGASLMALMQGDYEACAAPGEECLELYRALDDKEGVGRTLWILAEAASRQGRWEPALAHGEGSLALARELDHTRGIIISLSALGATVTQMGDYPRAKALLEEALALAREHRDRAGTASVLLNLGDAARIRGDHSRAARLLHEGLVLYLDHGEMLSVAACIRKLALVAGAAGRLEKAARLSGAAETLREDVRASIPPFEQAEYERATSEVSTALGESTFAAAWAEGRAMTSEQAVEYALAGASPAQTPLTRREREVASLVEKNLTNRRIAEELNLSKRTVDNHVRNILKKLRLDSREKVHGKLAEYSPE